MVEKKKEVYLIQRQWHGRDFPFGVATADTFDKAKKVCDILKEKDSNADYSFSAIDHYD